VANPGLYTVGGTVQAGGGIYIPRQADQELLQLCRDRVFAYVLTPRQMGKSSLMVQTAAQLQTEGVRTAIVDLQDLGAQVTAEQWYFGFLVKLEDQLELDTDVVSWWGARSHLGVSQRLTLFFEQVLLQEIAEPVVIFVDEIDSTLSLDFTDDFFVAIRSLYVSRATQPAFQRLSFVLIGVAMPGDLIRDARRTPFNIGQRVDLTDFTLTEAMPLAAGLGLAGAAAQALGWVLQWTGGHPYLTQRLCQEMAQVGGERWTEAEVDRLVGRTFLGAQSEQDNNLQFVRDMLTKRAPEPVALLKTYRDIRRGRPPVVDEEQSLVKSHLKLAGVVKREGKALQVRNQIYRQVFDRLWVAEHLPINWRKSLRQALIVTGIMFALLPVPFAIWAEIQRREAKNILLEAEIARKEAEAQRQEAIKQRQEAIKQRQLLEALLQNSSIATTTLSPRLKAFLDMLAWSSGTAQPNGYSLFFSGEPFISFKDHPRQQRCATYLGRELCADSAGRYVMVSSTWDSLVQRLRLPDFSPQSQDRAAIELIREQDALNDVETGKLESAIHKVSEVWGSLPNSSGVSNYGFQVPSINTLRSVYDIYYTRYLYPEENLSK